MRLTTECASLFYPNHVPKTLETQNRLNLILSNKLLCLPRLGEYGFSPNDDDWNKAHGSRSTVEDIAKDLCKKLSISFAPVKRQLPEVYYWAQSVDMCCLFLESKERHIVKLFIDEEDDKEEVANVVAFLAYTEWMKQVFWEL
ncbi:hypothetical protein BDZ89DRAFT_1080149, partial [Hymenopellis radicata]